MLAKNPKSSTQTSHPDPPMKRLIDALKRYSKRKERSEEYEGEHPTDVCIKRFEELRKPQATPPFVFDDDPTNHRASHELEKTTESDTDFLADLERAMTKLSLQPTKTVTFDLPENTPDTPPYNANDSEDESPTSQNDEVDERLAHAAWLRRTSENVYMSNRKSMNLRAYVHAAHRRTETPALLDSGATENFMGLTYAKWLKLLFKHLPHERPLLNVDGTMNKTGSLKYYVDLQVQTGTKRTNMRFFLTDLGHHRVILGYPWFAANQPKIDWARGWIDTTQLPLILRDAKADKPQFNPSTRDLPDPMDSETLYVGRITVIPQIA